MTAQEAVETIGAILERVAELPERAGDFAASVEEKLIDMAVWIEKNGAVTLSQQPAIENVDAGVAKWLEGEASG